MEAAFASPLHPSIRRRQHLVAAIVRVELAAALALDGGAARGWRGVLRQREGAAQAIGAAAALAGSKSGAGGGDADDEQGSRGDFDQQSHGEPVHVDG